MVFRKIISLSIAISFLILLVTGILSFFSEYARQVATIHTVFGIVFTIGALMHLSNNFKPLKGYFKGYLPLLILGGISLFFSSAYFQITPIKMLMDWGAKSKAKNGKAQSATYEVFELEMDKELHLTVDLMRAEHFWHPQIAIWTEDTLGNFLQTLYVTKATAKGLFFGGRSKENFKTFDTQKAGNSTDYRRVNALPVWSHSRGVQYEDGMYVPTKQSPLSDGISGATPIDNFKLTTSTPSTQNFIVKLEINVAFDDNEFYSEFDFPDDAIFHSGTGQLGQPSLLFETPVDLNDGKNYYLMELIGHGHQSGGNGVIYEDMSSLTTALEIVERIVLGVKTLSPKNQSVKR